MPVAADVVEPGVGVAAWLCRLFELACVVILRFFDELEGTAGPVAFEVFEGVECVSGLESPVVAVAALLREFVVVLLWVSPVPFVDRLTCRVPFFCSSSFKGNASSISTSISLSSA